jgi:hypothetical protein
MAACLPDCSLLDYLKLQIVSLGINQNAFTGDFTTLKYETWKNNEDGQCSEV